MIVVIWGNLRERPQIESSGNTTTIGNSLPFQRSTVVKDSQQKSVYVFVP